MRITDAGGLQRARKRVAVELRVVAGARYGSHVDGGLRNGPQAGNKFGKQSRRMA